MSALALSFGAPLLLGALILLPVIWWLLRLTPPKPREEVFPPTRILEEIGKQEETPAKSPWWLTLIRLAMAAFVIAALAEPIWNAQEGRLQGDGPILVVVDDGWTSGSDWDARQTTGIRLVREADDAGRPVTLVLASEGARAELASSDAQAALARLEAAQPKPVRFDLSGLAEKIASPDRPAFSTVAWLSSGLETAGTKAMTDALKQLSPSQTLYFSSQSDGLMGITQIDNALRTLNVTLERADPNEPTNGTVTAFDAQGRSILSQPFQFEAGSREAKAAFELPVELRNEITRVAIDDGKTAGGVRLLDERFRRRRVGLISGGNADRAQPLLSPLYYISRALSPFSEIRESESANVVESVPALLEAKISTLVLADIGTLPEGPLKQVEDWVQKGGLLVRFAGPRLAAAEDDTLVPVPLRRGGRSLGGTLTWGTPQPVTGFDSNSPFAGIPVPADVTVTRQVLAEPGIDLASRTWASLADGTPLVTASRRGDGWIVLFHVTADASWSNLPLSGAFVEMLRRIVAVSNGALAADQTRQGTTGTAAEADAANSAPAAQPEVSLPPLQTLNGVGRIGPPNAETKPLLLNAGTPAEPSLENPPGFYGTKDAFVAVNLLPSPANLKLLDPATLPQGTQNAAYTADEATLLKPWLLGLALILLAIDCLAVLWMAGALSLKNRARAATAAVMLAGIGLSAQSFLAPGSAYAQDTSINIENTLRTRVAYVKTGDPRVDDISRKGLVGLTQFVSSRTSLEPAEPVAVDLSKDELSFFPLIYWPISATAAVPDTKTMARVDAFMKKGGTVLFDTRDQISGGFGSRRVSPETQKLRAILATLDVPALEPVPESHVLTRAFYLLNVFPGRYLEGKLWVESAQREQDDSDRPARQGDGVSSILITSNDMAGAWAVEADGSFSLPIVPPNPTQRVYAYRTGVNILMYTLTGNYKSDQVHIPALLERLGQ